MLLGQRGGRKRAVPADTVDTLRGGRKGDPQQKVVRKTKHRSKTRQETSHRSNTGEGLPTAKEDHPQEKTNDSTPDAAKTTAWGNFFTARVANIRKDHENPATPQHD